LREEEDRKLTRLALDLAERGYSVTPSFLDSEEVSAWNGEAGSAWRDGGFRHAGVGRGDTFRVQPEVRNDQIRWLEPQYGSPIERRHFERMEELRLVLNRELYLGLLGFEAHLSVFSQGARYRCHLDQFRNAYHRIVSAVLYLNPDWTEDDGGALRLYLEEPESAPWEDVLPTGGTLVLFLSARFHHEVLPAGRERLAVTGWFTRRS
jgi:SM-20-related protein